MSANNYYSKQILSSSINIEPHTITGDINKLILHNIKLKYESVCNKDGYIKSGSIEIINRSIGQSKIIDNKTYVMYNVTYSADIITPSIGTKLKCVINSNNKMGLLGYIKGKDDDTIEDSPYIIIIPRDYFGNDADIDSITIGDTINIEILNFRIKYMGKQIQIVAKPL